MHKSTIYKLIILVLAIVMLGSLVACSEVTDEDNYPYDILHNDVNKGNIDTTTKDQAVDMTSSSIKNLKEYLKSVTVSDIGYYMGFDFKINTENGSNFRLKFDANLYAYPYSDYEEGSAEYNAALAIHNRVIKKSDILLEWYDGQSNELLIGFYFDGENASVTDPGNNLYLNLQGEKRYYENFGDTVLFQQFIRLITQIDIDTILANNDSSMDESIDTLAFYLGVAITNNYKVTLNGDTTSIYYDTVNLNVIVEDINDILSAIFSPFDDKIDPLTNKYLRFKFSTIAHTEITSLSSDMRFLANPDTEGTKLLMTGFEGDFVGTALSKGVTVPFTSTVSLNYSARVSDEIKMNLDGYTKFEHGQYEFIGDLYIPMLKNNSKEGTTYDLHIYTSLNEYDNTINRIDARFYDKATQQPMLMAFYQDELLYINTEGISEQFGGPIELEDIGFPKVYLEDIDLAALMKWFYDTVNNGIVSIVDTLLDPDTYLGEPEPGLIDAIMRKMVSTEDTMTLTVDHELLKDILKYTQEVDPNAEVPIGKDGEPIYSLDEEGRPLYTTYGLVYVLEEAIGYNLDEIASILGIQSAEKLIEYTWFEVSYNVETGIITIEMYTSVRHARSLIFRMRLQCVVFGQTVEFPDDAGGFEYYKLLGEIKTLSGTLEGTVKFSGQEPVNLSPLLGTFIGDRSGLNTTYYADSTATIDFFLIMDQYIQWSEDDENLNAILGSITNEGVNVDYADIANSTRGRMAFYTTFIVRNLNGQEDLVAKLYAYNVSFNEETYKKIEAGETLEDYGYVYVDLSGGVRPALSSVPLVMIREDIFLESLSTYLGTNQAIENASTLSLVSILSALMEDATVIFTSDYIGITTSNLTVQRLFGVDDLVANFKANIGLKSRVKGDYNLFLHKVTDDYASYEVGELSDMTVSSIYDSEHPIHKTIEVTFTWIDGKTQVLDMFFNYYRRTEPKRSDYNDDETYQADYDAYIAYINSIHNLTLVDGKETYYPKLDGPFMGVERDYTLTIFNPSNKLFATSIIQDLVKYEYEWEPLEAKPSTIECINSTGGSASYPANFLVDWESVTIEGIPARYYTVIVGEGSLGEFSKTVRITVLNRLVVNSDGSAAETVFVLDKGYFSDGLVYSTNSNTVVASGIIEASDNRYYVNEGLLTADTAAEAVTAGSNIVAREIVVDGRKYYTVTKDIVIGETTVYVRDGIAYRDSAMTMLLSNVNLAVEKAASVAASVTIDPYEYIIARYNNATYREVDNYYITVFLRNMPFTLHFAGGLEETASFEWSFDEEGGMFVERGISEAGGILYVHTVFKNQTIALKLNVTPMQIANIYNAGEDKLDTYTVDVLDTSTWTMPTRPTVNFANGSSRQFPFALNWSATYASNVSLNGAVKNEDGVECPFPDYTGNKITAFIDIYASLGIGEWFAQKIVEMIVEVPKKELLVHNQATVFTTTDNSASGDTKTIDIVDIVVKGSSAAMPGYWFVDPRYASTLTLPGVVTCYFQEEGGVVSHKDYTVEWDTTSGIVSKNADGTYSIFDNVLLNLSKSHMYELTSSIGSGDAKYSFSIAIVQLPQTIDTVVFADKLTSATVERVSSTSYKYHVDVFGEQFVAPKQLELTYAAPVVIGTKAGADVTYTPTYTITPTHPSGNLRIYTYVIGDENSSTTITLEVVANTYTLDNVVIVKAAGVAGITVTIDKVSKTMTIEGLNVNAQGKFEFSYSGDIVADIDASKYEYTYVGTQVTMDIMEFVEWLLTSNTVTEYTAGGTDGFSTYAELVDFRKNFSSQGLSGTGQTVTLRLSSVPGVLDFDVTLKGSVQYQVSGIGISQSITLYQYGADGEPLIKDINGYALSNVKTEVTIVDGNTTRTETYSNLDWYVDGTSEAITGNYEQNSLVRYISRETIYGKHTTSQEIRLYSHLPDGTRVTLKLTIPYLDWSKFSSIEYSGDFDIVNGVVTVPNIYAVNVSSAEAIVNQLPTTIRFYNLVARDVQWEVEPSAIATLASLRYDSDLEPFVLARAIVDMVGEVNIAVKIDFASLAFDNADLDNSIVMDKVDGVSHVFDSTSNTLSLTIEPYKTNVNGYYNLDRTFTLNFVDGKSATINNAVYTMDGVAIADYSLKFGYSAFSDGTNSKTFAVNAGHGLDLTVVVKLVDSTVQAGGIVNVAGKDETVSQVYFGKVYAKSTIVINGVEYYVTDYNYIYAAASTSVGYIDYATAPASAYINGTLYYLDKTGLYTDIDMTGAAAVLLNKVADIDTETATITMLASDTTYIYEYDKVYACAGSLVGSNVTINNVSYTISGNSLMQGENIVGAYYAQGHYDLTPSLSTYDSVKVIDPYAQKAVINGTAYYLPSYVNAVFDGVYTELYVEWDISQLAITYLGSNNVIVQGTISKAGLPTQTIAICVSVKSRETVDSISLFDQANMTIINAEAGTFANYTMYVEDTFLFDRFDLPRYAVVREGVNYTLIPISFETTSSDFAVAGGGHGIVGHIVDEATGQLLSLAIVADTYTFVNIWRPTKMTTASGAYEEDYTKWEYDSLMSPVAFTFIDLKELSGDYNLGYKAYKVMFRVEDRNPYSATYGQIRYETKFFVPSAYASSTDNILYFDNTSIEQARTTGADVKASFYLGMEGKSSMTIADATYRVASPQLHADGMAFSYDTKDGTEESEYLLIDPLNLTLPEYAYLYTNWSELSRLKFRVSDTTTFANINLNTYIGGDLLLGRTLNFTLVDEEGNDVIVDGARLTRSVRVKILFLDRTLTGATLSMLEQDGDGNQYRTYDVTFIDNYSDITYQGGRAPYVGYDNQDGIIKYALNLAIRKYGHTSSLIVKYDSNNEFVSFTVAGFSKTYTKNILLGVIES